MPHLVAIVQSDPTATLEEIRREFQRRSGIEAHTRTILVTLRKHGIRRRPSHEAVVLEPAAAHLSKIELQLANGRCLRFDPALDTGTLTRLVRVLETA